MSSVTLAIFVPKMNVNQGQRGQRGQRRTTITIIIPRREFCSMILRTVPTLSLTYVYIISNPSRNLETEAEDAAQVLEHFVHGTSRTNAYPSAVLEPTVSFLAPDFPNMYWLTTNDPQRQGEKLVLIRDIVDAMPELDVIYLLYEVFVTRCQGPLGNVVHTPTFMEQAENFWGCLGLASPEAQVMALSRTISMDTLSCYLLAVRMLTFTFLTARARSRLSSHTISTWLVSFTSESSCGRASSVACTFQEVEVTRLALPSRRGVALLWFDCQFTSCHHAFTRWPRGIVSARCNLGHCNFWSPETRFASTV